MMYTEYARKDDKRKKKRKQKKRRKGKLRGNVLRMHHVGGTTRREGFLKIERNPFNASIFDASTLKQAGLLSSLPSSPGFLSSVYLFLSHRPP